jgi:Na+-translocating ferredoxin:NAD+ oxidoreductase subunit E
MTSREQTFGVLGPLSLTPLLGASDSLIRAVSLLLLLWLIGGLHLTLTRLIRPWLNAGARLLASALLAALLVSCVELLLQAQALALYQGLGLYLALIGIHCVVNESSRATTLKQIVLFSLLMLVLGVLREMLGNGTLLSHAQWLFGASAAQWEIHLFPVGLHLALLTPGAFMLLGLLLAARNAWHHRPHSSSEETLHP